MRGPFARRGDRRSRRAEGDGTSHGAALGAAAASWASSHRVAVNGVGVRYRDTGSGRALVLVHGLGVSADYWVRVGPPVAAAGFRVIAPDLPGFGLTPGPPVLPIEQQALALADFCAAMGIDSAVFLGHSISCQAVVELAAERPALVAGLILAAPTGEGVPLIRLVRQAFGLLRDAHRESLLLAALVGQAYLRAGPGRVLRTWRMGARHDPLEVLTRVTAPGIVIIGEKDPVVDRSFATALAERLHSGAVVEIAGAAHAVNFEPTGTFNRTVIDFLSSLATRRSGEDRRASRDG